MTKKGISETIEFDRDVLKEQYGLEPDRMRDLKGHHGRQFRQYPRYLRRWRKTAMSAGEYGTLEKRIGARE
jgi:hypothetical protein